MAGEVSSPGARRRRRRRQLPRPAWYSTPSAKIKEQTPRHTIVETFLTLALARARSTGEGGGGSWGIKGRSEAAALNAVERRSEVRRIAKVRRDGGGGKRKRGKEER